MSIININSQAKTIVLPSSVTQTSAYEGVSGKYQFINTGDIVKQLESQGLVVSAAGQSRSKKYEGFQKHVVRMRMPGQAKVGDSIPEIVVRGSHNGTSTHEFSMGLYRLICSNGLAVGSNFVTHRVRHMGASVQQIVEDALNDLHTQLPFVAQTVEAMRNRQLSAEETSIFARQALELRGAPAKAVANNATAQLESNLLIARRNDDRGNNLWEVMNRVQENTIRGTSGLRRVTSATRDLDLNRGIWNIAEGFLKAA